MMQYFRLNIFFWFYIRGHPPYFYPLLRINRQPFITTYNASFSSCLCYLCLDDRFIFGCMLFLFHHCMSHAIFRYYLLAISYAYILKLEPHIISKYTTIPFTNSFLIMCTHSTEGTVGHSREERKGSVWNNDTKMYHISYTWTIIRTET